MSGSTGGRQPRQIDRHVGASLRASRKASGVSQEELANALGISFQQVQKYERGDNRISASKLYEAAQKLGVPLSSFFDGLDTPRANGAAAGALMTFLEQRGSHELMTAFMALTAGMRRRLVELAEAMADDSPEQ